MKNETVTATFRGKKSIICLDLIAWLSLPHDQWDKSAAFQASHYFTTGNFTELPAYKSAALNDAGWIFVEIGFTKHKGATWGAKKK